VLRERDQRRLQQESSAQERDVQPERRSARLADKAAKQAGDAQRPVGAHERAGDDEPPAGPYEVERAHDALISVVQAHEAFISVVSAATSGPNGAAASAFTAAIELGEEPHSYAEAMRGPDADKWRQGTSEELEALRKNGTYEECVAPGGEPVVKSKLVFKIKRDKDGKPVRYKVRAVACGYTQREGVDYFETFAPVARMDSIRTVLALSAAQDWELDGMDVDTAFLQSEVKELIYVRPPKGFEKFDPGGRPLVWRLRKSIYGLKQSSRNWHKTIDTWMIEYGFTASSKDPCVYVLRTRRGVLIVCLYVDDLLIAGSHRGMLDEFKEDIARRFKMKDTGELGWMLGVEIIRNRRMKTIELRQSAYIDSMLKRFRMSDCKPVATPAQHGEMLERCKPSEERGPDRNYRAMVGSLLYAAMMTRPDIAYAVQALSRHLQATGPAHVIAAKRVLRYLKGTRALGIKFNGQSGSGGISMYGYSIYGYVDSDWAGDTDTRRSTGGHVYMLAGGPISWCSRLMPTVALSSTEAEYMAACEATQEAVYLRQLLSDLGYEQKQPTTIFEDNQGCIAMTKNPVIQKKSKHIDIKYHFTRERVEMGQVELKYIATEHQLADLLTKPLERVRTEALRVQILGYHRG
jgi:hypothetical protein